MLQLDRDKIQQAHKLLEGETTTLEKFESVRVLIKGISPKIDQKLEAVAKAINSIEKLQKGEVIELTAENLSEETENDKKRKKAILFLIKTYKDLRSEVERVKIQINSQGATPSSFGKIAAFAKGPFGLTTVAAVIVVAGIYIYQSKNRQIIDTSQTGSGETQYKQKTKAIFFQGKLIPLSELATKSGTDCDSEHYHAQNGENVKALDRTTIPDPGACAFGKLSEVRIEEVEY